MPLLARRKLLQSVRPIPMRRSMTASAQVIELDDKQATRNWGKIRPGWQAEAWAYRRNLGELRYACAYLGNSSMRIRLFPAAYVPGDEVPRSLEYATDIPDDLKQAAQQTLLRLATGGPLALSMMQKKMTENFEVSGETYLIGETDPLTSLETWSLRSTSEVVINNSGECKIFEYPGATSNDARTLDPANTFISRLWWPDPEWGALADSPVRSILDLCEELLLLGKDVRATARSRLALNGILGIPDTLSIIGANPEAPMDPNQDPFWQTLIETVTSALSNEGSAAAVVPLMLRGPAEALAAIRHIKIERGAHDKNIEQRLELISRMATGLDLPSEVLTGKADLNHWTAWQVDDDSFRHHIEPIQVVQNDAFTAGFLWPMLDAYNSWDPAVIRKILVWHDATELLTHPDRADDAFKAWDRFAISDEALRKYLGFPDEDEPNSNELLIRIVTKARTLDPTLVETILKRLDPTLPSPPPPTAPAPPVAIAGPKAPAADPATPGPPPASPAAESAATQYAIEAMAQGIAKHFMDKGDRERISIAGPKGKAIVAAAPGPKVSSEARVASRKLVDIDRELRIKLHTACNAAVKRALEKAGAKVVSKARGKGSETIRASLDSVPLHSVCAKVGPTIIAALGLDAKALSDAEFAELKIQWDKWVSDSSDQALRQAARIAGIDSSAMKAQVGGRFADDSETGWIWLESHLQSAVSAQMAAPLVEDIFVGAEDTFIAMGDIRGALAIAGGFISDNTSAGISSDGQPLDWSEGMGQVATGDTVRDALSENGVEDAGYVWVHGPSGNPFEPHLELDGEEFSTFDAPGLQNNEGFPDYDYFAPGDHSGCSCDFMPLFADNTGSGEEDMAASGILATGKKG